MVLDQHGCTVKGYTRTLVHPEDRGKGFLCVIQGSISIVEDANTVPQLRIILRQDVL